MAASEPRPGSSIYDLDTPATLIDLDRMESNIRQWQAIADRHQVKFRPHIKTHKIPEIARMKPVEMRTRVSAVGQVSNIN